MFIDEKSGTNSVISRRENDTQGMVQWTEISVANDPACSNYLFGRRRRVESGHCTKTSNVSTYRSTLASKVPLSSSGRAEKRCPTSRQIPKNYTAQNQRCCSSDPSHNSCRCDSLEHANDGQGPRIKRGHNPSHMAQTQFETTSYRNFQTQSGQALHREIARCCRPIFESPRQSNCLLCRREESNSSIGTHSSTNALASGGSCSSITLLHTTWNHDIIRRFKHARWTGYRRLHAASSASRIYPVLTTHQCQDSARFGLASYRRQLWDTQTPTRAKLAEAPSQIPFAFYSNIQLMAQHGGAMVW